MADKELTQQNIIDGLLSRVRLPRELGALEYIGVADDENDWIEITFKNSECWKLTVEKLRPKATEPETRPMDEILADLEEAIKLMRCAPSGDGEMIHDDLVEVMSLMTELVKLLCQ